MSEPSQNTLRGPNSVLFASTLAFTICFAIWMVFAVLGIPIKKELGLNETQFGLLAAMPVLSGSLIRPTLGVWTDQYGGRPVFFVLMLSTVIPIWLLSYATEFWHFLILALFVGLAGGSFSVGTPYVARWFSKERQGLAMGVFGAGNSGAALTKFVAPAMMTWGGTWKIVPKIYAAMMLVTALVFWAFSASKPEHLVKGQGSLRDQLRLLKDPNVWRYCQYYSVVFGGYVGLALWLTKYYMGEYGFSIELAALLAACFSLPGGMLRAVGGWLSDKYGAYVTTWAVMWVCWFSFFVLSYPQTQFTVLSVEGPKSFHLGVDHILFTGLVFTVGIAMAIGKASVFKFIADEYPTNIGAVSGLVGLAGGLGGFFLPIIFGGLVDFTGVRSSAFMFLFCITSVSLVWMHFSFIPERVAHGLKALAARQT